MNAQTQPLHPAIVPPIQSPVGAVTRAEALAASLRYSQPEVRRALGSLIERSAEATATYRQLTADDETTHSLSDHPIVEDYESPLYDVPVYEPPYPDPYCPVDHKYRSRVMALLIAGLMFLFAGTCWLISLLFIAFS